MLQHDQIKKPKYGKCDQLIFDLMTKKILIIFYHIHRLMQAKIRGAKKRLFLTTSPQLYTYYSLKGEKAFTTR